MNVFESQFGERPSPGTRGLKAAVPTSFQSSAREVANQFRSHSKNDWQAIVVWPDICGMALDLLDRVKSLEIEDGLGYGNEALCWEWRMPKVQQR